MRGRRAPCSTPTEQTISACSDTESPTDGPNSQDAAIIARRGVSITLQDFDFHWKSSWIHLAEDIRQTWACSYCHFLDIGAGRKTTDLKRLREGALADRLCCSTVLDAIETWQPLARYRRPMPDEADILCWSSGRDWERGEQAVDSSISMHYYRESDVTLDLFLPHGA
jgi:hypothetical protein